MNLGRRFVQQITAIRLDMICIQKLDNVLSGDRRKSNELQLPGTESVLLEATAAAAVVAEAQVTFLIIAHQ